MKSFNNMHDKGKVLSIIVPFFNSKNKCNKLLQTLAKIEDDEIELIFVDDGSIDGTLRYLEDYKNVLRCETKIVRQENKGPGGARNYGLNISTAAYVWFVDSDDDINQEAVDFFKKIYLNGYDFIDFNIQDDSNIYSSITFREGSYVVDDRAREKLLVRFGRATTKIIKKSILTENNILYPENCYYEDNPMNFFYPYHIRAFYKSDIVGYIYNKESESITRNIKVKKKFYDRMATASYGYSRVCSKAKNSEEKKIIEDRFINIYLFGTISSSNCISKAPGPGWVMALRVMKSYREQAIKFRIDKTPLKKLKKGKRYKSIFLALWLFSYLLPSQEKYFDRLHMEAWNKPIKYIY
ncbi:glycosyltransferase family 2 protein [Aidingimonas halophila]|uniref:Glycosyltransferase involved in cell wall bisynthesis n=1 Tax=Aidingimonas halophila TaxID=574349 RepID=A0A1H3CGF3_9GAMM|nr:glycosyltransferase family 2 protein [Aidingimonas halophila]GHC35509.1 hypothetical protein GCM10008094_30900 [Aidingimonas halophila]SDX53156.1 Glycosyltransferase involved in cell wall bisynthesis [Aidingimonas halophila]